MKIATIRPLRNRRPGLGIGRTTGCLTRRSHLHGSQEEDRQEEHEEEERQEEVQAVGLLTRPFGLARLAADSPVLPARFAESS